LQTAQVGNVMMLVVGRLNCQCEETKQWLRNEREKKRGR